MKNLIQMILNLGGSVQCHFSINRFSFVLHFFIAMALSGCLSTDDVFDFGSETIDTPGNPDPPTNGSTLTIYAAEIGIGKFHREDNKRRPYAPSNGSPNVSSYFILPEGVGNETPKILNNSDGSVTIFFSNLEELLVAAHQTALERNQKVQIFNISAHGLPGGMAFPMDIQNQNSSECEGWRTTANGPDKDNYDQYYSTISKEDIDSNRQYSQQNLSEPDDLSYFCMTGLKEWRTIISQHREFVSILSNDVQFHFLSCTVGLGNMGNNFSKGLAQLLLADGSQGRIMSSLQFGLLDGSMQVGMGFWDYQSDEQLNDFNLKYPENRRDKEFAQKGSIRITSQTSNGPKSVLLTQVNYMMLGINQEDGTVIPGDIPIQQLSSKAIVAPPKSIRIPRTNFVIEF